MGYEEPSPAFVRVCVCMFELGGFEFVSSLSSTSVICLHVFLMVYFFGWGSFGFKFVSFVFNCVLCLHA